MGISDDTELIRHIIPEFIQGGEVSSQAFRPPDSGLLSTYDGDMITVLDSLAHFKRMGKKSMAVATLQVKTYKSFDLKVVADRLEYDEHVTVDFTDISKSKWRGVSRKLRNLAVEQDRIIFFDAP
ncbi:MAG: hypothetical protein GX224_06505 [Thermoplasmatales archaeon]|nr:hypothetical protein [Thermoplasmatales archaeon]